MKQVIQNSLRRTFGVEFRRAGRHVKELPVPLTNSVALKVLHLYDLFGKIESVPGQIVECGVGWGRSLYALCLFESAFGKGRRIVGFDSFEGFPEPSAHDKPEIHGIRKGRYSTRRDTVIQYLVNSGIPQAFLDSNVTLIQGFFDQTLKLYDSGPIAFLHLDVDLYQSYRDCLEHLYPLVADGGVIALDEYQANRKFPGCKKAVDEFLAGREVVRKSALKDRYYIVKGTR